MYIQDYWLFNLKSIMLVKIFEFNEYMYIQFYTIAVSFGFPSLFSRFWCVDIL